MKANSVTAWPLCWPEGWPRTPEHRRADGRQFKTGNPYRPRGDGTTEYVGRHVITFDRARRLLSEELARMKAIGIIVSTDVELRLDGEPRAGAVRARLDPGVAVYFTFRGKPMVMAQDAYSNIAANVRSLGLAIEALRQLERHGGGQMMERAFAGFTALPPPEGAAAPRRPWWEVLRFPADPEERELVSLAEAKARYNTLAMRLHPDRGGSQEEMSELNLAVEDAERELKAAVEEQA